MNQMFSPKTGFSRRGFMIGIAGLTFAVAVGHERIGYAATEAPDVSGTVFTPWVSIATSGEISIMAPATEMGNGSLTSLPLILAEEGKLNGEKLHDYHFTTEHGPHGGILLRDWQFSANFNPEAFVDCASHFDFIDGGGCRFAALCRGSTSS